ncbi:iron uptake transporter permease EfeU [Kocuria sp.]|uniref:iron uptake transporter permease EfeU n=1 Tax=Kocuria sp. TaxID=1871328 RepID=UPI0026DFD419|nr:iron uptake transporter permease EfeU [Kocuria sp.]MDO5367126.1 iron uptake transporter permease EfeU [Kocuria sp.]
MLQTFLIGLREGLEAALIVAILIGYLKRTGQRFAVRRLWLGIVIAVAISLAFGALLTFGPSTLTFEAQEIIGGTLSIVAVGFVTWMIFWMASASRGLKRELESRADVALRGSAVGLILLGAFAVGREGLETALFLWAATRANGGAGGIFAPTLAALAGILVSIALAWLITRGLLKLNLSTFFRWTGGFLVLIAAGVLAYGFHDLQEAGVLPGLNSLAFDVSEQIPPTSWYGVLLKGVFNFSPATTWLEFGVWWAYVLTIMPLFIARSRSARRKPTTPPVSSSASVASTSASA